jgi:hypothetical protein
MVGAGSVLGSASAALPDLVASARLARILEPATPEFCHQF